MVKIAGVLGIVLSLAQTAFGQGAPAVPLSSAERAQIAGRELSGVVDPTRTTFTSPQPIFTLEATAGDTTGTAAIGWQFGDLTFDAKVSGPINASGGEAQFADLDGLRGEASVDVGLQFLRWQVTGPRPSSVARVH